MGKRGSLKAYRDKRDFAKTGEPIGDRSRRRGKPRFVIQQHDASSMHFDFRIEVNGVLKSWAVPKGPSTDPHDKRLAIPTEDHPLDYVDYEGVIPKGEYGGGAVIVWDTGTYRPLARGRDGKEPVAAQIAHGHLAFWLEGKKLRGGYALTRIAEGDDERWLLVKIDDDEADARRNPVSTQRESVLSGKTVRQIAAGRRSRGRGSKS